MDPSTGITLTRESREPLYRHIFDEIVSRIRSRAFPPGYKLPPTRRLATELKTNRNTVVRAYADSSKQGSSVRPWGAAPSCSPTPPPPSTPLHRRHRRVPARGLRSRKGRSRGGRWSRASPKPSRCGPPRG